MGLWRGVVGVGLLGMDRAVGTVFVDAPPVARQMSYSIWIALNAAALLSVGFVFHRRVYRFVGLALFGLTSLKVLLVDMKNVNTLYRIASFIGVGLLLVAASWLYYKFFDVPDKPRDETKQTGDGQDQPVD